MKKILITAILVNTLILLTLSNIAKADHKGTEHIFNGISFSAKGSENYQVLETDLVENKFDQIKDELSEDWAIAKYQEKEYRTNTFIFDTLQVLMDYEPFNKKFNQNT